MRGELGEVCFSRWPERVRERERDRERERETAGLKKNVLIRCCPPFAAPFDPPVQSRETRCRDAVGNSFWKVRLLFVVGFDCEEAWWRWNGEHAGLQLGL